MLSGTAVCIILSGSVVSGGNGGMTAFPGGVLLISVSVKQEKNGQEDQDARCRSDKGRNRKFVTGWVNRCARYLSAAG